MTLALDNAARLMEWSRLDRQGDSASVATSPIEEVGVIGVGTMGRAIAAAHAIHGLPVAVTDCHGAVLAEASASILAELTANAGPEARDVRRLIRATPDLADIARCGLVIESVVESLSAKRRLFSQIEPHLAAHTIVASNTSTIPIGQLGEGFADPSRFCGVHFLHPVRERLLVEIVRGPQTSDCTVASVVAHVRRIGKIPIVVPDGPGFLVNRLLFPYLGEALDLLQEGVPAEAIERAAVGFGMAVAPLRLIDEIGLDTVLQAAWVLAAAFPDRVVSSPLLVSMIKAGRSGRKTGAGFYDYSQTSAPVLANTLIDEIAARWGGPNRKTSNETIAPRLVLPMLLEATRLVEEGALGDPRDVDLAMLFGLGFPADKGGLLWWAEQLGPSRVLDMLESLGKPEERFRPTPAILAWARTGVSFLPPSSAAIAEASHKSETRAAGASPS